MQQVVWNYKQLFGKQKFLKREGERERKKKETIIMDGQTDNLRYIYFFTTLS